MADVAVMRGVSKRFGGFTALDGIDLTVSPGVIRGFLGPNGAGKTTTFYMVVGLVPATSGRVFLD